MVRILQYFRVAIAVLAIISPAVGAQSKRAKRQPEQTTPAPTLAQTRADMIAATKAYKESLEELMQLQKKEVERLSEIVTTRRDLLTAGIISKKEVDESLLAQTLAEGKVAETQKRMQEADQLATEVAMADQLERREPVGSYRSSVTLIRYTGASPWALSGVQRIDDFFKTSFGRPMPISALGQTTTHDRLGFDHRNAVDVAVHPDSPEGQALIQYLKSHGISFYAFRGPVPGSATGAHIHIGPASHRVTLPM
jgi:hypothetical protein